MKTTKKNLLLTFDYELFLGEKSGSAYNCVLNPTRKLLKVLEPYKAKCIFFVDLTWLLKLQELSEDCHAAKKDYSETIEQLREIYKNGHYIFPHIHPHWDDAIYMPEINQWKLLRYVTFRLHYLSQEERAAVFQKCISYLREILGTDYMPLGYRAGGWSIQPFSEIKSLFKQYGIKYDFTVLPGSKFMSKGPFYDFSEIKNDKPYTFSDELIPVKEGEFIEFPISMLNLSPSIQFRNRVLLKLLQLTGGDKRSGDGYGILSNARNPTQGNNIETISIELLTRIKLPLYLEYLKNNNYFQMISHPKMLTPHTLKTFKRFIDKAYSIYEIETDFMKLLPLQ